MMRSGAMLLIGLMCASASAESLDEGWKLVSRSEQGGLALVVYAEAESPPGRPAFRIETRFAIPPAEAAAILMQEMAAPGGTTPGERRRLIQRGDREALVHSYIDLPFMFSDRELAIRIRHHDDGPGGVHRIDWVDENQALPPVEKGVLRLRTTGYWEFRPDGRRKTRATYLSRAEVGGSLPAALSRRLMRAQAVDAVVRLQSLIERGPTTAVAAPPLPEVVALP